MADAWTDHGECRLGHGRRGRSAGPPRRRDLHRDTPPHAPRDRPGVRHLRRLVGDDAAPDLPSRRGAAAQRGHRRRRQVVLVS
ncbi:hypothetical protein PLANTIT3_50080 [Plantibacter sp. T3]|nr:hypothetical protein PLANTIT3_50080 [Plantibacter sp. T3]